MTALATDAVLDARTLDTIAGGSVAIPDPERLVHLQFRRFAGCPICNLHLRSVVARHDEIADAGILEVVLFHSSAEDLRPYEDGLPPAVVADPERRLYREFGVESGARSLLHPRAMLASLRGILRDRHPFSKDLRSGPFGLPADFLVGRDGRVLACKYGEHADDQWSVDELLELARAS